MGRKKEKKAPFCIGGETFDTAVSQVGGPLSDPSDYIVEKRPSEGARDGDKDYYINRGSGPGEKGALGRRGPGTWPGETPGERGPQKKSCPRQRHMFSLAQKSPF